jgi:hypothetical protein
MRKIDNYESVQASTGEFARPTAGGYVCKIINVTDVPLDDKGKGDYLKIEYDIAKGDFEGYYKEQFDRWGGFWSASFIRSYKEKALGMFKHFTSCVENSNKNYTWDWNETGLVGKVVGLVIGEEEYLNNAGVVKSKLVVKEIKTVEDIEKGNFKVPEPKKLAPTTAATAPNFVELKDDEELPF